MRKRILTPAPTTAHPEDWLDFEGSATVEVASEDKDFPIESSLSTIEPKPGWRAAQRGAQTIRLVFDEPQQQPASELSRQVLSELQSWRPAAVTSRMTLRLSSSMFFS